MIFLDYLYELPNATKGMDDIVVQTVTAVPGFIPLLLLFVFFVVFLGGISRQKARTGTSDYAMWAVVASLSTFMVTLIMTLIEGLIRLDWLVIVVVITIFSGVWLFLDKKQSEV
ncbi:MAG TPA: hypothetical protein VMX17_11040 [Candidatus Glassbacteria bacterium]|nr:hypothetical protein [Candidatus Glassbacteria bacterium]